MSAAQLGEHARLIRGVTFKPADKCDPHDEGAVVCMRTKNVQATLDQSDLIAIPSSLVKNPEKMLSTGDILVSTANSWNLVGKCCQVEELQHPSTAGGFISILRPKTDKLDSGYLYRWFSSGEIQSRARSFGNQTTNISNLNSKRTLQLELSLPPLAEQKRIAGVLDAADALRAKRRESLDQLDTLLQSTFLDMFGDPVTNPMGWERRTLGEIINFVGGSQPPKNTFKYEPSEDTIRLIQIRDFKSDKHKTYIPKALARRRFEKDDVMIARYGPPVFQILTGLSGSYNVALMKAEPIGSVEKWFIFCLLNHPSLQAAVLAQSERTAGQSGVNKRFLNDYPAYLPPMEVQSRFASIVESVEQQKTSQRTHLTELDTLFGSLQSRAFSGDL